MVKHKLWVEVIKALKLPASATSAAFALRLHYLHLLYAFEQKQLYNIDVPPSKTPAPAVQIKREREGSRVYGPISTNIPVSTPANMKIFINNMLSILTIALYH